MTSCFQSSFFSDTSRAATQRREGSFLRIRDKTIPYTQRTSSPSFADCAKKLTGFLKKGVPVTFKRNPFRGEESWLFLGHQDDQPPPFTFSYEVRDIEKFKAQFNLALSEASLVLWTNSTPVTKTTPLESKKNKVVYKLEVTRDIAKIFSNFLTSTTEEKT